MVNKTNLRGVFLCVSRNEAGELRVALDFQDVLGQSHEVLNGAVLDTPDDGICLLRGWTVEDDWPNEQES